MGKTMKILVFFTASIIFIFMFYGISMAEEHTMTPSPETTPDISATPSVNEAQSTDQTIPDAADVKSTGTVDQNETKNVIQNTRLGPDQVNPDIIVNIEDEEIPTGTESLPISLPKTGGLPAFLMYLAGIMFASVGFVLGSKKVLKKT